MMVTNAAPNIVRIAQWDAGLTQRQAVETANQRKLAIAPNLEFERRLMHTDIWRSEREMYTAISGTLVAYEKAGARIGRFITYSEKGTTYAIEANPKAIGMINTALAVDHLIGAESRPNIEYEDKGGNNVLVKVEPSMLKIIEAFPAKEGWYVPEPEFGIPVGREVSYRNKVSCYPANDPNPNAHLLVRVDGSYVGLAARQYFGYDYEGDLGGRRYVLLNWPYSAPAGALGIRIDAQAPAAENATGTSVLSEPIQK
jgi:hypothetical protein